MATTVAKTKKDVDNMSLRDRIYDSLSYTYGKKGERISSEYDKAKSAADRQSLSRGMQRSYYAGQTSANIDKQKIDALNDNESALIADYENRLLAAEQQEAANDQWERQFAAGREDAAWNKEFQQKQFDYNRDLNDKNFTYQQERDRAADNQWQLTFNAGREDAAWNRGMQEKQYAAQRSDAAYNRQFNERQYADQRADTAWQQRFQTQQYSDQREDVDWNRQFQTQQYADQRADTAWQQNFQTRQYADQRADVAWQQDFQTRQYADQRADVAWNQGFNERQFAAQRADAAWNQAFQSQQYADQRSDVAYNRAFNEQQYADQRADVAYNREFNERQLEAQQEQWREQFDYNRMSDEQRLNYNWVTYSLQNGNDVSDEMLERAGLSRDDYNRMRQQAQPTMSRRYSSDTTPAWQTAGFASEEEYNRARAAGYSDPAAYRRSLGNGDTGTPYQSIMDSLGGPNDSNRLMSIASMVTGIENPTRDDIISAGRGPLNTERRYTTDVIQDATDILNARRQRTNTGTPYQTGVKKAADEWKAKG